MIRWASLVADTKGDIDYMRVRSLASVILALMGGAAVLTAMVYEIMGKQFGNESIMLGTAALVVPLTGGKIADALSGRSKAAAIVAGTAPGRRSTDVSQPPEATDDGRVEV
jgi:hypothetical protein